MYACMYVFPHVCMYVSIPTCMHACMYSHMYACMYVFPHACMYSMLHVLEYLRVLQHVYIHTYIHTYTDWVRSRESQHSHLNFTANVWSSFVVASNAAETSTAPTHTLPTERYVHVCMRVYIHMHIFMYVWDLNMFVWMCMCVCVCVCVRINSTYTHIAGRDVSYTHSYIHIYTCTYAYTHSRAQHSRSSACPNSSWTRILRMFWRPDWSELTGSRQIWPGKWMVVCACDVGTYACLRMHRFPANMTWPELINTHVMYVHMCVYWCLTIGLARIYRYPCQYVLVSVWLFVGVLVCFYACMFTTYAHICTRNRCVYMHIYTHA